MQVALDPCDRTTAYADIPEEESLTDPLRARAIERARQLGAQHVEFWRPPYGRSANRMEGFVELARVVRARQPESEAGEPPSVPAGRHAAAASSLLQAAAEREGVDTMFRDGALAVDHWLGEDRRESRARRK